MWLVPADVLPEEQAVNTEQNLRLSAALHDDAPRRGTARYYVPSAFLREFAAILKGHLLLHVVLFTPFVALAGYFFLLYLD